MASLGAFAGKMRVYGKRVEQNAGKKVRNTVLAVDRALVFTTPIDKGTARSNWVVALGAPSRAVIAAYAPGEKGFTAASNAEAALAQAAEAVSRRLPGQDVYISNNLPYIRRLNDGWSAQAPAGFVEAAVLAGTTAAAKVRLLDG